MKQKLRSLVRKIFLRTEGGLRFAWRAALGIALALAAYSVVLYGLAALFGALFDAWRLTAANLTRAPRWAQSVVRWHSDFCYALACGAGIAVSALWARRFSAPAPAGKAASETIDAKSAESASEGLRSGASAKHIAKDTVPSACSALKSFRAGGASSKSISKSSDSANPAITGIRAHDASSGSASADIPFSDASSKHYAKGARSHACALSAEKAPSDSSASSLRAEASRPDDHARGFLAANTSRSMPPVSRKPALFAALLGLLLSGGLGALALATDCMRVESPWSAPHFALSQLSALLVLALGRLLGEMLTKRLCFDALRARSHRRAWMASVVLATLLNLRSLSGLGALNALLMAMVGCALYERGGLLASAALQTIWAAGTTLLFGFPGMRASTAAVWPLYHVSDAWLTGGNAGPMSGAWFTFLLSAALLLLLRRPLTAAARKLRDRSEHRLQKRR